MVKKIALTLMSVFLILQTYKLMAKIDEFEIESLALTIFIAWIINMFVTGIFGFAGFAWPTERLMPNAYYRIRAPRKLKKLCKLVGVESFRKMLLATLWRSKELRAKHFDGTASGITNFDVQSKKSEFGHVIPLILLTFIAVYLIVIGKVVLGIITLGFNLLGNLYPVLLQRHHRMRLDVLKRRYASKGL